MKSKTKIQLQKLKEYDTVWHELSTVVFKSTKEIIVIGRLDVNTKKLIPLDDKTIKYLLDLKWWNLPVDVIEKIVPYLTKQNYDELSRNINEMEEILKSI